MQPIVIKNASLHNLKNIDITLPANKLVVITGVSGSGKSTLAFDILFEAGRKSYLQAIGVLDGWGAEKGYDQITGLRPTVANKQGIVRQSNPRSVVGTKTGILNYLGSLYADEFNRRVPKEQAMTAAHFSFNSPLGMCLDCQGRGHVFDFDFSVLLPEENTTLPQMLKNARIETLYKKRLLRLSSQYDLPLSTPFKQFPQAAKNQVLYGHSPGGAPRSGLDLHLRYYLSRGKNINGAMVASVCPHCEGYRIGEEARAVKLKGKHIGQLAQMTISQLCRFSRTLPVSSPLLDRVSTSLQELMAVNLSYLSLYRPMPTLSGGEKQRLSLMSHFSHGVESLIYIFDEPTAGLHELEKKQLLLKLQNLRALGNAVLIVEHDQRTIRGADHVVDIGPLAGEQGGELVYQGTLKGLLRCKASVTGLYLSGKKRLPAKESVNNVKRNTPSLRLKGVCTNNLKSVSITVPLGHLVGVTGVSGCGKSSLVSGTLVPAIQKQLSFLSQGSSTVQLGETQDEDQGETAAGEHPRQAGDLMTVDLVRPPPRYQSITGVEQLSRCIEVTQAPIGRRSTSNPVSYLGLWDRIRKRFAEQTLARKRGYKPGHFSFNASGACQQCSGSGQHRMWLGSTFVNYTCDSCKGQRYQDEILDIRFRDHSITDVLQLSAEAAQALFYDDEPVSRTLSVLARTGMGYIRLGQPTSSLSGGEAQRLKLSREIARRKTRQATLFVLDEPTTGLSMHDVAKLLELVNELVVRGDSVIVIEHDVHVLSHCDWLLEIGPGAGDQGGKLLAKGTPQDLQENPRSLLGSCLVDLEKRGY